MDERAEAIAAELAATRAAFHALAASLTPEAWRQPSVNPAWTVGGLVYHITVALQGLPADVWILRHAPWLPRPPAFLFHRLNEWYTRRGAAKHTPQTVGDVYDDAHERVLALLRTIRPDEWDKGAQYPDWDPMLSGFVTIEELFHYPSRHFEHHADGIRRSLR